MRWGRAGSCSVATLLLIGACSSDSGQTGSPVATPPDYETPNPERPEAPGSHPEGPGEGGSGAPEEILPLPIPSPGNTALIGDRLLVTVLGSLAVLDVSTPTAPTVSGRLPLEGDGGILAATSLDRVIVLAQAASRGSVAELPLATPASGRELLHVDASTPEAPVVVRRDVVPEGAVAVVVRAGGYTALGGTLEPLPERECGTSIGEIDFEGGSQRRSVTGLWLQRFGADAPDEPRRELGPGHWQVSTDQTHAIRLGSRAREPLTGDVAIEVVDLETLQSVYDVTIGISAFGTPSSPWPSADYSAGVLAVSAGPRVLAFDVSNDRPLLPASASSAVVGLRFSSADTLILEGTATPLVNVDRAGAALSLVPVSGGGVVASLLPLAGGYIALDGLGGGSSPELLRATTYVINTAGELELAAQLQTDWRYSPGWQQGLARVDPATSRVTYGLPVDDSDDGRIGVIDAAGGQLRASNLATIERMGIAPLVSGDAVLAFGGGLLQPLRVSDGGTTLGLETQAPLTLGLERVWFEVEHGGVIWAKHREDTGESFLSVRSGQFGEPTYLDLPHPVDAVVPIDSSHVAALGVSVVGQCDSLRVNYPSDVWAECGPHPGNGVSVLALDGGAPRVVRSIELSSFLEGEPLPGVERSIDWQGFLQIAPGKLALWGRLRDECSSAESCAELDVPAYRSFGTGSCAPGQDCAGGVQERVSGYFVRSWLFVLDVTNPEDPVLSAAVKAGAAYGAREDQYDLARDLLGYDSAGGRLWAYAHREDIYDENGNGVRDEHGNSVARWHLQLLRSDDAGVSFGESVNVPGETVWLQPGDRPAEHTAFTLEPRYRDGGEQYVALNRLRIADGEAFVEESLDAGSSVVSARGTDGYIALLEAPSDYCAEGAQLVLRAADVRGDEMKISDALELSTTSWSFAGVPEPGQVELRGGPAGYAGRLTVDITTDPPSVVSYEW